VLRGENHEKAIHPRLVSHPASPSRVDPVSIDPICLVAGALEVSAAPKQEKKMDKQVESFLTEQAVAVVEQPPEGLTREERIQRLEQAIRWASAWQRRAAESGGTRCFHCALRLAYTSGLWHS
jgi:hypothetical protein